LKHILKTTSAVLGVQVKFVSDCIGQEAENAAAALRRVLLGTYVSIVRKKQEVCFQEQLASLGIFMLMMLWNCSERSAQLPL
jgi:phosphoglycerate kinase